MTKIELNISDQLAGDLDRNGLLAPAEIERVLREELRAQARKKLGVILDKARNNPEPPMSMEEIQAEVDAVRAERRRGAGS